MRMLRVRAAHPDRPVPIPGVKRQLGEDGRDVHVIRSDAVVEVESTRYYRRRIAAGDLVLVEKEK
jgi:hypothetical protein